MTEVSKEYGAALFMLACENEKKDEYADGLSIISNAFYENPGYIEFLSSPGVAVEERLGAIEQAFAEYVCADVLSFIKLLCEKGRMSLFPEAAQEYNALLEESRRVIKVRVSSAVELTDEEKQKIATKLESKFKSGIESEYIIDESLIGGIVIEADGKILDGSLRSRLHDIKDVINR